MYARLAQAIGDRGTLTEDKAAELQEIAQVSGR